AGVGVVVDVLSQQDDLSGAVGDGLSALGQHLVHRDVTLATAHARNDAERAVVIAALDDPDEVTHARAPSLRQRLALGPVVASLKTRDEAVVLADRDNRVDQRESRLQALAFLADDAPGHGDGALGRLPLPQLVELGLAAFFDGCPTTPGVEIGDVAGSEGLSALPAGESLPGMAPEL